MMAVSILHYGPSTSDARSLVKIYVKIQAGWCDKQYASCDGPSPFLKWKNTMSIRTPRATNLGGVTIFNKHNVEKFFANLGTNSSVKIFRTLAELQ